MKAENLINILKYYPDKEIFLFSDQEGNEVRKLYQAVTDCNGIYLIPEHGSYI